MADGTIPLWMIGKHTNSVIAQTEVPDGTGALTPGALTATLTGFVDEIDDNGEDLIQNIPGLVSPNENYVGYLIDDTFTVREIMRSYQNLNLLAALWNNAEGTRYIKVTLSRGANAGLSLVGNTWQGIWIMLDYSEDLGKPKSMAELVVRMVDLGNAAVNPSWSSP